MIVKNQQNKIELLIRPEFFHQRRADESVWMRETTKEPKMKQVLQSKRTCCTKSVVCSSPIGNYRADFCDQGLHWVKLCDEVTNDNFLTLGLDEVSLKGKSTHGVAVQFEKWMKWYFGSSGIKCTSEPRPPPICPLVASYESTLLQSIWRYMTSIWKFHICRLSRERQDLQVFVTKWNNSEHEFE